MINTVRDKMLSGQKTVGTFFELGSENVAECAGLAGLDFIIIDMEHGACDPYAAIPFIRTAKLYGTTPFIRVPDGTRASILKSLDGGAMGLIIPSISTVEEVREIVQHGKYAPLGQRGVASSAGTDFWVNEDAAKGLPHLFAEANRKTMLVPQCETLGCLEHLEEIAALDGVDGIFVGPFDLSTAMGIPGDFRNPRFLEALRYIQAVCQRAGKPSMIFCPDVATARDRLSMGYDSIAYSMDASVLIQSLQQAKRDILAE